MQIENLPFGGTNREKVAEELHPGITGTAKWRTRQFDPVRVRMVEPSPGYLAGHGCQQGHFLLVLDGRSGTESEDGRLFTLLPGMSYQVADRAEAHRSATVVGARLFVFD